jgi:uncharacterized alkaline shock family protein YloU
MNEQTDPIGRIEVAPEVLTTIARHATLGVQGVSRLTTASSAKSRPFRRGNPNDGILLQFNDDKLIFDIYVLMEPHVNLRETSKNLQNAVVEAMDTMVGLEVGAVNIHVEDVVFNQDNTS